MYLTLLIITIIIIIIFDVDFNYINWYQLGLVLCILFIWFFSPTILSTRNKAFQSNLIQLAPKGSRKCNAFNVMKWYIMKIKGPHG